MCSTLGCNPGGASEWWGHWGWLCLKMLFSIVEGSGSMAWCSMLVQAHSGEITPTIMEAPTGVQLCMVKDPGVKLLGRWVRDEMAVPSLPHLRKCWDLVDGTWTPMDMSEAGDQ